MIFTTLETYFSSHSWRLQLCHSHNLYQISHTFLRFSISRFLLRGIVSHFTSTQGPFQIQSRRSVDHHTCHASCVWKVDESSFELFFLTNSKTNFVTKFSGAILRRIGRIPSLDGSRYLRPSASSVANTTGSKAQALTFRGTLKECCFRFVVVLCTARQGKP